MKSVAAVIVVALLGCNPKPTMITGSITFGLGAALYAAPDNCEQKFCLFTNRESGGAFMIIGALIAGIGLLTYIGRELEETPQVAITAPPAPFPVTAEPPPEFVDPADAPDPPPVPGIKQPPLPAETLMFDNPSQRQFALQASSAARRGRCAAAIASGKRLSIENDQKLLAADDAYAKCVANH